jgi:hypothetical protein
MELGDIEHPRETLGECRRHLDLLRILGDDPAWQLFCQYLADSASHVEKAVLSQAVNPAGVYEQEYLKGRASAFRLIPVLLQEYCETLKENIHRITMLMREETEDERRDESFDYRVESAAAADDGAATGNAP